MSEHSRRSNNPTRRSAGGRPEQTPLANTTFRKIQRWRLYGDDFVFKLSRCANCQAEFYEPNTMNLMCCPLCANLLWKKKNYPPQHCVAVASPVRPGKCPWCGKTPEKDKYCDQWCREAIMTWSARERMREKAEQKRYEEQKKTGFKRPDAPTTPG